MAVSATLRYELVPDWEQLPEGHMHPDVSDVAVDSQDRVYLLARTDQPGTPERPIFVYDRTGRFITSFGMGVLSRHAHGITVADDAIYVADFDHTVRKMTLSGEVLMTLGTKGKPDIEGGLFNQPSNTAIAPNGDIFVSGGNGQNRIHRFSAKGEPITSWGETGHEPSQFDYPHGLWVSMDGRVFVADRGNNRIQIFSPDGEYLDEWTDTQRPNSIEMDADGLVYIAEGALRAGAKTFRHGKEETITEATSSAARVAVFDGDGKVLARWGGKHALDDACAPGNFASPYGLCVDSRGDIYVGEVTWSVGVRPGWLPPDCKTFQKFARVGA
jgi:DNA-binding beta-propeller fold protein YncE